MGAVISTLTFPVRRPFLTVALAAATLAASVHFFGPVATFGAISKGAKGVSMAFSDAAKVVTGFVTPRHARVLSTRLVVTGLPKRQRLTLEDALNISRRA